MNSNLDFGWVVFFFPESRLPFLIRVHVSRVVFTERISKSKSKKCPTPSNGTMELSKLHRSLFSHHRQCSVFLAASNRSSEPLLVRSGPDQQSPDPLVKNLWTFSGSAGWLSFGPFSPFDGPLYFVARVQFSTVTGPWPSTDPEPRWQRAEHCPPAVGRNQSSHVSEGPKPPTLA